MEFFKLFEQRVRKLRVDHRADIYALGLLLNEIFTGQVQQGAGYRTIGGRAEAFAYLDPLVERMIQQAANERPNSIEEIKKELLKRQNEFISLQKLDEKRREVIPAFRPNEVAPVTVVGAVWESGVLQLTLSRVPEADWIQRFRQPRSGFSAVMGKGPEAFHFAGNKAHIQAGDHQAQQIVDHFKNYLVMATQGYQTDLRDQAAKAEREERERLAREQAEAEKRARVMRSLHI